MNRLQHYLLAGTLAFSAHVSAITIDGDLKDWIAKPTGSASDWTPLSTATKYAVEDQNGSLGAYLNPGYGGQLYDAEAIYVDVGVGEVRVAVVTGLPPTNSDWKPGDLAFDFGNDGVYEYGVVTVGDAVSGVDTKGAGLGTAGQVYRVSEWNYGIWDGPNQPASANSQSSYRLQHPTSVKAGTLLTTTNLVYAQARYDGLPTVLGDKGGVHYVIETVIPVSAFTGDWGQAFTVHWTMGCANDWISVDPPPGGEVPEPTTLSLLALGLTRLLRRRRVI